MTLHLPLDVPSMTGHLFHASTSSTLQDRGKLLEAPCAGLLRTSRDASMKPVTNISNPPEQTENPMQ
jgi:hypothetical protein